MKSHDFKVITLLLSLFSLIESESKAVTLGEALDTTNLVWTTGGSWPWTGAASSLAFDGADEAFSGNQFVPNSESYVETTVVGPGTLSFWWRVSTEADFDFFRFYIGDTLMAEISVEFGNWTYQTFSVPAGTNSLRWAYVKDDQVNVGSDQARLDRVIFTKDTIPLAEVLNTCGVTWTSGGNANPTYWSGQTNVTHDGSKAAESGAINHLQESWMEATVPGVTNVSFWWKVSSQTNADVLGFYRDGVLITNISGEVNWQQRSFTFPVGTHTFRWRYNKNDLNVQGQDRGWVDQVAFKPDSLRTPFTLASPAKLPDGRFRFELLGQSNCTCRVEASTNLASWFPLADVFATNSSMTVFDAGAVTNGARFYRGSTQ